MKRKITLTETLDLLYQGTKDKEMSFDTIIEKLSARGFGALLVGQSLLILLPTGAIPGLPALMAVLIIISSMHFILGSKKIWLPKKIRDYKVATKKLEKMVTIVKPITQRIDRIIKPRLSFLFTDAVQALIPFLIILLAFTIPVLGFIPFLADVPAFGILLLGLCLCSNDGILFILSLIFLIITGAAVPYTISTIF